MTTEGRRAETDSGIPSYLRAWAREGLPDDLPFVALKLDEAATKITALVNEVNRLRASIEATTEGRE